MFPVVADDSKCSTYEMNVKVLPRGGFSQYHSISLEEHVSALPRSLTRLTESTDGRASRLLLRTINAHIAHRTPQTSLEYYAPRNTPLYHNRVYSADSCVDSQPLMFRHRPSIFHAPHVALRGVYMQPNGKA